MMAVLRRTGFLILVGLGVAVGGGTAAAQSPAGWDGTWAGGWENGDGVQIIIAGGKVIGVGRGMKYPDLLGSQVSADSRMLSFAWVGGDGMLERTSDRGAAFTMRERGVPVRKFVVERE
jgi:hypothetical protein